MANKSVEAFRRLTVELQRDVFNDVMAELNVQADAMMTVMRTVVPRGRTGRLADSIRKHPGRKETVVVVRAGGPTTTHPARGGDYDYAVAVEHGTEKIPAHPFFYPTYRLMKDKMIRKMKRTVTKTVKKYSAE
jgi:HK97 gp10 family phage protein